MKKLFLTMLGGYFFGMAFTELGLMIFADADKYQRQYDFLIFVLCLIGTAVSIGFTYKSEK